MHPEQQQKRINEDERLHLADSQLEVFGMVGKPLPTSFEQGVDIRVVQQILGHSQLSQTERYTHVTRALSKDAANRMSGALWDDSPDDEDDQGEPQLQPGLQPETIMNSRKGAKDQGQNQWGGWGSNPRPADYESALDGSQ
jgi:hypothetical protein